MPCPPPTSYGTSVEDMRQCALCVCVCVCVLSCFSRARYISSQSQVRLQSPSISLIFTSTHGEKEKRERNQLEPSPQIFQAPGCLSRAGTRVQGDTWATKPSFLSFCPPDPRLSSSPDQTLAVSRATQSLLASECQDSNCLTWLYGNSAPVRDARVLGSRGHLIMAGSKFPEPSCIGGHLLPFKRPGCGLHRGSSG